MSFSALLIRVVEYMNEFFSFGFTALLHSTVIIAFAFLLSRIMRGKGMVVQSAILRAGLVAVLISPFVVQLYSVSGMERYVISLKTPVAEDFSMFFRSERKREAVSSDGPMMNEDVRTTGHATEDIASRKSTVVTHNPSISHNIPDNDSELSGGHDGMMTARVSVIVVMLVIGLWLVMAVMLFVIELRRILYTRKLIREAVPVSGDVSDVCLEIAESLGVHVPDVLEHPCVGTTFLTGVKRPVILTSAGEMQSLLTTREVFVHELAHLKRRDHLWNFLGHAGLILFPVQPLMWFLTAKIEEAGDYICDDYVVAHFRNDHVYASQLYDIATTYRRRRSHLAAGIGVLTCKSKLLKRVERILDSTIMRHLSVGTRDVASVLFLFLCSLILTGFVGFKREILSLRDHLVRYTSVFASTIQTAEMKDGGPGDAVSDGISVIAECPLTFPAKKNADIIIGPDMVLLPEMSADEGIVKRTPFPCSGAATGLCSSLMKQEPDISLSPPLVRETDSVGNALDTVADVTDVPLRDIALEGFAGGAMMPGVHIGGTGGASRMKVTALKIDIPSEYEYGYHSETDREKMGEFYRSLRKNRKYPVWSPDASKIAFNDSDYGIWVVNADGGRPTIVYDNYYKLLYQSYSLHYGSIKTIGFSPDGSELAFRRYGIDASKGTKVTIDESGQMVRYYIENPCPVIESVNLDTGESRILAENAVDGCWNRGGDMFAYITEEGDGARSLWLKDLVSGEELPVSDSNPLHVCFDADDTSLFVSEMDTNGAEKVVRISLRSGKRREMVFHGNARFSDLSPDGGWLLCTDTGSNRQFLYNIDGNTIRDIEPPDMKIAPWSRFSPDGTRLLSNMSASKAFSAMEKWDIFIQDIAPLLEKPAGVTDKHPESFAITGNFPNPFNLTTTIEYTLAGRTDVSLVVYNSMGQAVRTLLSGAMEAGWHRAVWDGRNDTGETVATGVYISRLSAAGRTLTHKMMLVK